MHCRSIQFHTKRRTVRKEQLRYFLARHRLPVAIPIEVPVNEKRDTLKKQRPVGLVGKEMNYFLKNEKNFLNSAQANIAA